MGYYTRFELTTKERVRLDINDLETMSGGYIWEDYGNYYRIDDCVKWYDFDKDMIAFSKKKANKTTTFILNGEGEESGDIWKAYYRNGKSAFYKAVMTFPEFKEEDFK